MTTHFVHCQPTRLFRADQIQVGAQRWAQPQGPVDRLAERANDRVGCPLGRPISPENARVSKTNVAGDVVQVRDARLADMTAEEGLFVPLFHCGPATDAERPRNALA